MIEVRTPSPRELELMIDGAMAWLTTESSFGGREVSRRDLTNVARNLIKRGHLAVAFDGGTPVGVIGVSISENLFNTERTMHDVILMVTPRHRGKGIGKDLVNWAIAVAQTTQGVTELRMANMGSSEQDYMWWERTMMDSGLLPRAKIYTMEV